MAAVLGSRKLNPAAEVNSGWRCALSGAKGSSTLGGPQRVGRVILPDLIPALSPEGAQESQPGSLWDADCRSTASFLAAAALPGVSVSGAAVVHDHSWGLKPAEINPLAALEAGSPKSRC